MNSTATQDPARDEMEAQWHRIEATRSDAMAISQYCADRPYLEIEVPTGMNCVRRIRWTTVSHDQGFSGEAQHHHGTYEQSFTWFDAAVIARSGHDRVNRPRLQTNVHASDVKKKHVNTWDYRNSNDEVKHFLQSIREGDRICIIPKARHIAWKNYVYEAKIELFGEEGDISQVLVQGIGSLKTDDSVATHDTIYRSLTESSEEIRLIEIAAGQYDDPVTCELQYVAFKAGNVPEYEALSYCWGDSTESSLIKVANISYVEGAKEDAEMHVTDSLYEALRSMRYPDRPRTVWADAVCINQRDLVERSKQVALMPKIYTGAVGILVWLGPSTKEVLENFASLQTIQDRYEEALKPAKKGEALKEIHKPILDGTGLLVDSPLFEYEYFRRTWVLQEVYNAGSVTVLCGRHKIGWASILRLNQCLVRSMLIPNAVGKHIMPSLFAGLFDVPYVNAKNPKLTYKKHNDKLEILDVVLRGSDLEASDIRDKLFALLSFGKETVDFDLLPQEVRPDYQKDESLVFADFTRWWILKHKSLKILSAVHTAAGRTWQPLSNIPLSLDKLDHPTWTWWPTGKSFWVRGTLGLSADRTYNASLGLDPDENLLRHPEDRLKLSLIGYKVSKIISIEYYPFYRMDRYMQETEDEPKVWKEMHETYCHLFDPLEEWGTWRYGVTHQTPEIMALRRRNTPEEVRRKYEDHLYTHMECYQSTGGLECHGPTLFRTEDGQSGLCPPAAKEGDDIVVLYGGKVPYLLRARSPIREGRENDREYSFVGECFLDDYMDGLCIGENTEGEELKTPQVFNLV